MMKKILIMTLLILLFTPVVIKAEAPSLTKTPNRFSEMVTTQDAYEPVFSVKNFNNESFNGAKDLYFDQDDYLYVANTGNKEIVIFDADFNYLLKFGKGVLEKPTGVFVRDEYIYVSDYGKEDDLTSGAIYLFKYDKELNEVVLKESFKRPNSPVLVINDFIYRPLKIAVDNKHTMYVTSEGSYNGVLMINNENRFLGFFGPNKIKGTIKDYLLQFFYGNNEKALLKKNIPPAPYNVFLNDNGYIYTITQTNVVEGYGDNLKKVNNGGINFFDNKMFSAADFTSLAISPTETIYAVTSAGFIYEYDNEGELLFVFAGPNGGVDRLGLFRVASGVACNSLNQVVVLDEVLNSIQVFEPTNFTKTVHQALDLYNKGKYQESLSSWEEVLRYNALFDRAHEGIGKAYYIKGEYKAALEKFKIAEAYEPYSDAFWELRNIWIQKYLNVLLIALLLFYLLSLGAKKIKISTAIEEKTLYQLKEKKVVKEAFFMFSYLKSPLNSFYEAKQKGKVKYLTGIVFIIIALILYLLFLLLSGVLFKPVILERTVFSEEILKVVIPFLTYIFANYLISSLMEGEGTFKAIFINTTGALMPIIVILPLVIVLSNVLTYNEKFIYHFLIFLMFAWSFILLFFSVKDTHNFSVKETIYHFIMSILMVIVMLIVIFMIYMMLMQVYDFIADLIKEVIIDA